MPSETFLRTFLRARWAAEFWEDGLAICDVPYLFLQRDAALARSLAGAGIGAGALTTHGQAATMAEATIATQIHQALDVDGDLATQVTLDGELANGFAHLLQVSVGQILDPLVVGNARSITNGARGGATNAVNRREADFGVLMWRNVNTSNTCH